MDPEQRARAQELERKKQKLAEMRARKAEAEQNRRNNFLGPVPNGNARRETQTREELEESLRGDIGDLSRRSPRANGVENTRPTSSSAADTAMSSEVVGSRNLSLELTKVSSIIVPVKDMVQYSKSIQTDEDRVPDREFSLGSQEFDFDDDMGMDTFRGRTHSHELESPLTDDFAQLLPNYFRARGVAETQEPAVEEKKLEPPREFSEEEKNQIVGRTDFQHFFHTASKNMERMLSGVQDKYLVDYSLDTTMYQAQNDELLTLFFVYKEPQWTENRSVVGISCGRLHKEFVVVAYDADPEQPQKAPGLVCVWNTHSKMESPEYMYHSNSRLTSVTFAYFHQHLILAGCYSGQIVVWDYRIVTKKTPVNKSPLTSHTHTQPIFNLNVVGTRNSHGVCSVSSEGKVCFWNIENLAQPSLSKDLHTVTTRPVPTLSVSFSSDDPDIFMVGSEDGKVYMFNKNSVGGHAIQATREFGGHQGPVLAVHAHLAPGAVDFSHLFLTASSDWSIKLWSSKDPMLSISFESHEDVVVDVKWSPVHPAVFASIDFRGLLLLWNLNETIENPVLTLDVTKGDATLKKLAWSEDGRKLCVGDSKGELYVYDTHENLYSVQNKEFTHFARVLAEVKKQAEEDETQEQYTLMAPNKGTQSNVAALAGGGALSAKKN